MKLTLSNVPAEPGEVVDPRHSSARWIRPSGRSGVAARGLRLEPRCDFGRPLVQASRRAASVRRELMASAFCFISVHSAVPGGGDQLPLDARVPERRSIRSTTPAVGWGERGDQVDQPVPGSSTTDRSPTSGRSERSARRREPGIQGCGDLGRGVLAGQPAMRVDRHVDRLREFRRLLQRRRARARWMSTSAATSARRVRKVPLF